MTKQTTKKGNNENMENRRTETTKKHKRKT